MMEAFSFTNETLYPIKKSGKSVSKERSGPTDLRIAIESLEKIIGPDPEILQNIEKKLGLPFLPENEEVGNVCLANSPEIRDEFKVSFTAKNLSDYLYAVLHSPCNLEKYSDLSNNDFFTVPYPNDQKRFWNLASLGAKLRQLHLLELATGDKEIDDATGILKKIAEIESKDKI